MTFEWTHLEIIREIEHVWIDLIIYKVVHTNAALQTTVRSYVRTLHPLPLSNFIDDGGDHTASLQADMEGVVVFTGNYGEHLVLARGTDGLPEVQPGVAQFLLDVL